MYDDLQKVARDASFFWEGSLLLLPSDPFNWEDYDHWSSLNMEDYYNALHHWHVDAIVFLFALSIFQVGRDLQGRILHTLKKTGLGFHTEGRDTTTTPN